MAFMDICGGYTEEMPNMWLYPMTFMLDVLHFAN